MTTKSCQRCLKWGCVALACTVGGVQIAESAKAGWYNAVIDVPIRTVALSTDTGPETVRHDTNLDRVIVIPPGPRKPGTAQSTDTG